MSMVAILMMVTTQSQELPKVEISPNGIEPVVVDVPDKTAAEMYQSVKYWIQENYKNPSEVLKGDIPNELIRFDGYSKDIWSYKALGMGYTYDVAYTITLDFKDGKYRYTWQTREFWSGNTRALYTEASFFKKNGDIRKVYADSKIQYEDYINLVNLSIYEYIQGNTVVKNDDW